MKLPHYDVVIATPGSAMEAEYVKSLVLTLEWLTKQGMTYRYLSKYSSFVPSAREKTATDSDEHDWATTEVGRGEFTYDWLLWIDSDMVWEPSCLERLMSWNYDVISACCPINKHGVLGAMKLSPELVPKQVTWWDLALEDSPVEVDGVGFGFLLIKYGVMESMKRPWFGIRKSRLDGVEFPVNFGEDYSFCMGLKDSGYSVWLDPGATVQHMKASLLTL